MCVCMVGTDVVHDSGTVVGSDSIVGSDLEEHVVANDRPPTRRAPHRRQLHAEMIDTAKVVELDG